MLRSIAVACLLVVGCKADKPDSAPTAEPTTEQGDPNAKGAKGRDGKVDLGIRRGRPGAGSDDGATPGERGHAMVEERRKKRMAALDIDGDGQISDEERKANRLKRAEDMRKQLDTNNDGKVTPEELKASTFRRFDPDTVDADKDGNVTLEEIETAMAERQRSWGVGGRRGKIRGGSGAGSGAAPAAPGEPE